ncbi:unnamed protein product, partial [Ectocarpus fasciculatus]
MESSAVWSWQDGTVEDDALDAVAVGEDGSLYLVGDTRGSWGRENPANGTSEVVAVKLDSEGTEVFRWQGVGNSSSVAYAKAAATGPDGSMFIGGVG